MVPFYAQDNVFFVPGKSRWSYLLAPKKEDDKVENDENFAVKIDTVLSEIEKTNKSLKEDLPDNYFSRLQLEESSLKSLLDILNQIDLKRNLTRIFSAVFMNIVFCTLLFRKVKERENIILLRL